MALTNNNLEIIKAIAKNDIHRARIAAMASLAEDTSKKNADIAKYYRKLLVGNASILMSKQKCLSTLLKLTFKREKNMYTENIILNERLDRQKTLEAIKTGHIELKKRTELKRKLENINTDDFGLAIQRAIRHSNKDPYKIGRQVVNLLLNTNTFAEFDAIASTIRTITGCGIKTLINNIEDSNYSK